MFSRPEYKIGKNCYITSKQLGIGAQGTVYEGYIQEPGKESKRCAIKVFEKKDQISNSAKEIAAMQNLNHTNLVKMIDSFTAKIDGWERVYIILEFCNGGDLENYLQKNNDRLSVDDLLDIFRQIIDGFRYLKIQKIIHRDVKAENILIHDNEIKISDFGCSRNIEEGTKETAGGTPLYQDYDYMTSGKWNDKSDIYSLGVLLYHMLYIVPGNDEWSYPWYDKLIVPLSKKILNEPLKFRERQGVTNEIKYLISQMLIKDPQTRITWEQLFEHPLLQTKLLYQPENQQVYQLQNISQADDISFVEQQAVSLKQQATVDVSAIVQEVQNREQLLKAGRQHYERIFYNTSLGLFLINTLGLLKQYENNLGFIGTSQYDYTRYFLSLRALLIFEELNVMFKEGKLVDYSEYLSKRAWCQQKMSNVEWQQLSAYLKAEPKERELQAFSKFAEQNYQISYEILVQSYKASRRASGDTITFNGDKNIVKEQADKYLRTSVEWCGGHLFVLMNLLKSKSHIDHDTEQLLILIENMLIIWKFDSTLQWDPKNSQKNIDRLYFQRKQMSKYQLFLRIIKGYSKTGII